MMDRRLIALLVFFLIQSSCRKFVETAPGTGLIERQGVFSNEGSARSSVNGLLVQLRSFTNSMTNSGLSVYGGLSSDELYLPAPNPAGEAFFTNSLLPVNATLANNFWAFGYKNIYQANAILEGLEASPDLKEKTKAELSGSVKLIRALLYFYLLQLYGPVPLAEGTDYRVNATLGRAAPEEIYGRILQDLQTAEATLPPTTPEQKFPSKGAATLLLARTYLYLKQWPEAAAAADRVISSGLYQLAPTAGVFLRDSPETIWQLSSDVDNTSEGRSFIPLGNKPVYALTPGLLQAFETGDERKRVWVDTVLVNRDGYAYPFKYKLRTAAPVEEYLVVCRYGEALLIAAEAAAQQDQISSALTWLNLVRKRAGLGALSLQTKEALMESLIQERRIEFFAEWGHRWLDLKRWKKADSVLSLLKGTAWQATDTLYPLPQNELLYNSRLVQNPGY